MNWVYISLGQTRAVSGHFIIIFSSFYHRSGFFTSHLYWASRSFRQHVFTEPKTRERGDKFKLLIRRNEFPQFMAVFEKLVSLYQCMRIKTKIAAQGHSTVLGWQEHKCFYATFQSLMDLSQRSHTVNNLHNIAGNSILNWRQPILQTHTWLPLYVVK
jgi:hypothetical protein